MSNPYNQSNNSGFNAEDLKNQASDFLNRTHQVVGRKLTRSQTDKMVAGVLGGIGQTYGINPALLRVLFIMSMFLPGPQFLAYAAAWLIIPRQ